MANDYHPKYNPDNILGWSELDFAEMEVMLYDTYTKAKTLLPCPQGIMLRYNENERFVESMRRKKKILQEEIEKREKEIEILKEELKKEGGD